MTNKDTNLALEETFNLAIKNHQNGNFQDAHIPEFVPTLVKVSKRDRHNQSFC